MKFERVTVNVQFTLNESRTVAGLFFRPENAPLPALWRPPSYSKPAAFHESEVIVGDDAWKLGGTLLVPAGKGPFPGVVLVHGPGPNDRDETIYSNKIFADLAEGLASRGIAVLRYDKRTKVYGETDERDGLHRAAGDGRRRRSRRVPAAPPAEIDPQARLRARP